MTLIWTSTRTTTTTTVETELHSVTEEEFVTLLSAWHGTNQPTPIASHITEEVRTDVVDALRNEAVGALEDRIVATQSLGGALSEDEQRRQVAAEWASVMAPLVEAEVSGRTIRAITRNAA